MLYITDITWHITLLIFTSYATLRRLTMPCAPRYSRLPGQSNCGKARDWPLLPSTSFTPCCNSPGREESWRIVKNREESWRIVKNRELEHLGTFWKMCEQKDEQKGECQQDQRVHKIRKCTQWTRMIPYVIRLDVRKNWQKPLHGWRCVSLGQPEWPGFSVSASRLPHWTDSMSGHADSLKCMCDDFFWNPRCPNPVFQKDS